jgi:co-chaperonin GroES (HSP10)
MPNIEIEDMEGAIHPCNGFILIQMVNESDTLIVIHDPTKPNIRSGVVVEMSKDEQDEQIAIDTFEWRAGDLIFFNESVEIEGHYFVHWTDVFAFKRFRSEDEEVS